MRSSMPGTPLGIFEKSPLPSSLPALRPSLPPSNQKSQWSVEMTCRSFAATAFQSASWSLFSRKGGEQTHLAPSKPGRARSSLVKKKYWTQVSP